MIYLDGGAKHKIRYKEPVWKAYKIYYPITKQQLFCTGTKNLPQCSVTISHSWAAPQFPENVHYASNQLITDNTGLNFTWWNELPMLLASLASWASLFILPCRRRQSPPTTFKWTALILKKTANNALRAKSYASSNVGCAIRLRLKWAPLFTLPLRWNLLEGVNHVFRNHFPLLGNLKTKLTRKRLNPLTGVSAGE